MARKQNKRRSKRQVRGSSKLEPPTPSEGNSATVDTAATVASGSATVVVASSDRVEKSSEQSATVSQKLDDLVAPTGGGAKACFIVMQGQQVGRMFALGDKVAELGRSDKVTIPIDDRAISRVHATVHSSALGFVLTDLDSTNGVFVNAQRVKRHVLRDGDRVQLGTSTVFKFAYQDELEETLQKRLYDKATRDPLVDAHNRQYFDDYLETAFARAKRQESPLSAIMVDVDHFKRVNDTWGHLAGDQVLKGIADLINQTIRTEDVFARFGGEEFVLLLTEQTGEAAVLVAVRIRKLIESHAFEHDSEMIPITVSIGVATYARQNYPSPSSLIAAADDGLYEAKRAGRNRVVPMQRADTAPPGTVPPTVTAEEEPLPISFGTDPSESRRSGGTTPRRALETAFTTEAAIKYRGQRRSRVFHAPHCRYYNSKNCTVNFESREEAIAAGYKPGRHCKP